MNSEYQQALQVVTPLIRTDKWLVTHICHGQNVEFMGCGHPAIIRGFHFHNGNLWYDIYHLCHSRDHQVEYQGLKK